MRVAIKVMLEKEEAESLKAEAQDLGISVSDFIRLLIRQWSNGIQFSKDKGRGAGPSPFEAHTAESPIVPTPPSQGPAPRKG